VTSGIAACQPPMAKANAANVAQRAATRRRDVRSSGRTVIACERNHFSRVTRSTCDSGRPECNSITRQTAHSPGSGCGAAPLRRWENQQPSTARAPCR
jgi:hypothetical protein